MGENQEEEYATARQEIEKLQLKKSNLKEQWLELMDEQLSCTGLPGHLHRLDVKIKHLKSLLARAADALEKGSCDTDVHLIEELRKAAE